jgi:hypothetical protein
MDRLRRHLDADAQAARSGVLAKKERGRREKQKQRSQAAKVSFHCALPGGLRGGKMIRRRWSARQILYRRMS